MRVQHNIPAMNSYRNYNNNTSSINKNLEKLSSGYKINRAGDDAAGLAISEKMRAQISGLEGAQKNAKDGISLVQTAEGALTEVHSMLNRMYTLAEQSANGTYDSKTDRVQLQKEVFALQTEINRIADSANFNGQNLLDGSLDGVELKSDNIGVKDVTLSEDASIPKSDLSAALTGSTLKMTVKLDDGEFDGDNSALAFEEDLPTGYSLDADSIDWGDTAVQEDGTLSGSVTFTITGPDDTEAAYTIEFGGKQAVDGATATMELGVSNNLKLQIGDTAASYNQMDVNIGDIHTSILGSSEANDDGEVLKIADVDISTAEGAAKALDTIKSAIDQVSNIRGGLGAIQNRLEHTINNLSVMQENMQDAESTIRDTDVASEMMKYTKNSILVQSAQAMLAQANQQPQGVLQLLQ